MLGEVIRGARRVAHQSLRTLSDLIVLSLAYLLAFLLRFDGSPPLQMWKLLAFTWPYVIALEFAVLHLAAVTRFAWSYVGLREAARTFVAVFCAALVLLAVRIGLAWVVPVWGYARYAMVPIGIIGGNALLSLVGVLGSRVVRRILTERAGALRSPASNPVSTLLFGAGQAGALVAKEIANHPAVPLRAVGFIDDDRSKLGFTVHGVPVLGNRSELPAIILRTGAKQVVVTMTKARGESLRELHEICASCGIEVKVIPGIYQILEGKVNLSRIRTVSIEDLLGRETVELDEELLYAFLRGKRILVTGAGGSIGSELSRQIARFAPAKLVLLDRAEAGLFEVHRELSCRASSPLVVPCIGDICDAARIADVFADHQPHIVFHAAAHKHVPMMEWNPGESVKNNVFGTRVVANACDRNCIEAFVLISTDKAVNPTSVMGATKRVAEMYVQAISSVSATRFVAVRFGNVLGSTGSVLPIFKAQIAEGGPVTVTHPDMVRYFMTIPEASQLVMQAAAMGSTGQIFVLDMGMPVKILDMAKELICLSGLEPDLDIRIEFSGVRPGEKLFEELSLDSEKLARTAHEKIFIGKLATVGLDAINESFLALEEVLHRGSAEEVRAALQRIVPEMQTAHDGACEVQADAGQNQSPARSVGRSVLVVG